MIALRSQKLFFRRLMSCVHPTFVVFIPIIFRTTVRYPCERVVKRHMIHQYALADLRRKKICLIRQLFWPCSATISDFKGTLEKKVNSMNIYVPSAFTKQCWSCTMILHTSPQTATKQVQNIKTKLNVELQTQDTHCLCASYKLNLFMSTYSELI